MAKAVKFNLICDGNPVRTVDDLRNNFSIEDILDYYHNKLLHKWLSVRGYTTYLERINQISFNDDIELAISLVEIFNIDDNSERTKEAVYSLIYQKEKNAFFEECSKNATVSIGLFNRFCCRYDALVSSMIEKKLDFQYLRMCCKELFSTYYDIFKYDYYNLIGKLRREAPMGIYAMLTVKKLRCFLLLDEIDAHADDLKKSRVSSIQNYLLSDEFLSPDNVDQILGDNLKIVSGATAPYWKEVAEATTKIMVIRAGDNIEVKNYHAFNESFSHSDYYGKFLLFNGLEYRCDQNNHYLRYIEV